MATSKLAPFEPRNGAEVAGLSPLAPRNRLWIGMTSAKEHYRHSLLGPWPACDKLSADGEIRCPSARKSVSAYGEVGMSAVTRKQVPF